MSEEIQQLKERLAKAEAIMEGVPLQLEEMKSYQRDKNSQNVETLGEIKSDLKEMRALFSSVGRVNWRFISVMLSAVVVLFGLGKLYVDGQSMVGKTEQKALATQVAANSALTNQVNAAQKEVLDFRGEWMQEATKQNASIQSEVKRLRAEVDDIRGTRWTGVNAGLQQKANAEIDKRQDQEAAAIRRELETLRKELVK